MSRIKKYDADTGQWKHADAVGDDASFVNYSSSATYPNGSVGKAVKDLEADVSEQSSQIGALQTLLNNVLPQPFGTKTSYAVGEVCIRDNKIMQATQVASGVTWEPAKWTQVRINNVSVLSYTEV